MNSPESLIRQTLIHDGLERSYLLHVPPSLTPPSPLVLVLHGRGIDANVMLQITGGGFDALADQHGFVVVYPNAVDEIWNDGRLIGNQRSDADDVGFLGALIAHLSGEYALDPARLYLTGLSNGGFMAYRLACALTGTFAAFAPVAALMTKNLPQSCTPSPPVPMLIIAGTADPVVPYKGGKARWLWRKLLLHSSGTDYLSAAETARFWAQINHCDAEPVTTQLPPADSKDSTRIRHTVYGGGAAPVELYTVAGGGHNWPGHGLVLPRFIFGKTSRQIDACQVIWEFFQRVKR